MCSVCLRCIWGTYVNCVIIRIFFRNITCVDNIFKIEIFRLVLPMINKQLRSNMQQLVSYQTARRIYGERSYKKYVTKRTCISLTFSIAFFTLIIGKLWFSDFIRSPLIYVRSVQQIEFLLFRISYFRNKLRTRCESERSEVDHTSCTLNIIFVTC